MLSVEPASVSPSSPASCLSGCIAISLPPPLTQLVRVVTWLALRAVSPSRAMSKLESTVEESSEASSVVNSSRPSLRRISLRYVPNGLPLDVMTSTCGGEASVVNDQVESLAIALPT